MDEPVIPRKDRLQRLGFRLGAKGTHSSRNMMFGDLTELLDFVPEDGTRSDYREAVVEKNALGKPTRSSRKKSFEHLGALYGLDPEMPLFRYMRFMWDRGQQGRALVGFYMAFARDPLLRITAEPVLSTSRGEPIPREEFLEVLQRETGDRFSESVLEKVVGTTTSSWTTAGYLEGTRQRVRSSPHVTPGAAAMALFAGYLEGYRGKRLLASRWGELLADEPANELRGTVREAGRRGWLNYRAAGGVVEVTFPDFLATEEEKLSRESR